MSRSPEATQTSGHGLSAGPYQPFKSDPGWSEAWWWFGIPAGLAVFLVATGWYTRKFYTVWILPEGYGFLELGHFFIPLAGLFIAVSLLRQREVRGYRLLSAVLVVAAFACLYIAGEEHSWGQHFFHWKTPEYWAELNRQQETNLHNFHDLFDKKPRLLLEIGVYTGGLIIPLAAQFLPLIRRNSFSLFLPADAMVPVALGAVLFKVFHFVEKTFAKEMPVPRPAEAHESFLYLFVVFYLVVLARRIAELKQRRAS